MMMMIVNGGDENGDCQGGGCSDDDDDDDDDGGGGGGGANDDTRLSGYNWLLSRGLPWKLPKSLARIESSPIFKTEVKKHF